MEGKRRDLTLSFQLSNDFEVIGLLRGYVPSDYDSLGYAAHLVWRNPRAAQPAGYSVDSVDPATA